MIDKLQSVLTRYNDLSDLMSKPDAMLDMKAFTKMAREHSGLTELVDEAKNYIETHKRLQEYEEILNSDDADLKELVKDEIGDLRESFVVHEKKIKNSSLTKRS